MPSRGSRRESPSRADLLAVWLSLVVGLLIPFAVFIFSDGLEATAIATIALVPAIALFLEIRRRRAVWERFQSHQRHGIRFEQRFRANEVGTVSERPWWQVLGISERSAPHEVKAAYHAKVKQFHPDTVMGLPKEFQELAERKTKEINRAYGQACRSHRITLPRESHKD
jgi:hypothetical protein